MIESLYDARQLVEKIISRYSSTQAIEGNTDTLWKAIRLIIEHAPQGGLKEIHRTLATSHLAKEGVTDSRAIESLALSISEFEATFRSQEGFPEIEVYLEEINRVLDAPKALDTSAIEPVDGMLPADATLARLFDETGQEGRETAAAIREASRKRLAKRGTPEAKPLWALFEEPPGESEPRWMRLATAVLWLDKVKPEFDAPRFSSAGISHGVDQYSRIPKAVGSAAAWSFGAPGVVVDDGTYSKTPNVIRVMTRGAALLPPGERPAQILLPLEIDQANEPPFAIQCITDASGVISPTAAKLMLVMLTSAKPDRLVRETVESVCRAVFPYHDRVRARDRERIAEAAWSLGRIRLVLSDGTACQIFDVRSPVDPKTATNEQPLYWSLSPNLLEFARRAGVSSPLNGSMIVNMTGAMKIKPEDIVQLREYLLACSIWNDAANPATREFDPGYCEVLSVEELAHRVNALSPGALEYIKLRRERRKDCAAYRRKASEDKRKALAGLEALASEHKLLTFEKIGDKYKLLPTDAYLEARRLHHERTGKKPEPKPKKRKPRK